MRPEEAPNEEAPAIASEQQNKHKTLVSPLARAQRHFEFETRDYGLEHKDLTTTQTDREEPRRERGRTDLLQYKDWTPTTEHFPIYVPYAEVEKTLKYLGK